jgi:hypothetical protein
MHYRGKTPKEKDTNSSKNRYNQLHFIFKPRTDKYSEAELLVFEERNRLEELIPLDLKNPSTVEFHRRIYNANNYYAGLGFLIGRQKNSKTYKIEKAIREQLVGKEK